jgi:hypothetical protein
MTKSNATTGSSSGAAAVGERDSTERFRAMGVDVYFGDGHFESPHEYVLMMANGRPVTSISRAIHVYPTISQAVRRAANRYYDEHLFKSPLVNWQKRLRRLRGVSIYERQKEGGDA